MTTPIIAHALPGISLRLGPQYLKILSLCPIWFGSSVVCPVSVQNGNVRKGEGAASGPGPLGQQILKPDFFQNILAASKEQVTSRPLTPIEN